MSDSTTSERTVDEVDCRQNGSPTDAVYFTVYTPNSSPNGFDALSSEWNELLCKSRFNSLFLTHEWQTTWWHCLGQGDLWVVAFRCAATDELVGIAPLYCFTHGEQDGELAGKTRLTIVGCIEVSDYLDIIAARGWESAVCRGLLRWLQSPQAPAWDILDLCNLPEASLTYRTLPTLCDGLVWQAEVSQEDVAPQFALPLRYETYLQELVDKKQRHEIRRKQRRAEREADVNFYIVGANGPGTTRRNGAREAEPDLEREMEAFIQLQRASAHDKAEFMTPEMQRFFRCMAKRMLRAGYLRLCFLELNGEKAAALLAFDYDKRFWLYNSGYDPAAHAHLSPGWVLLAYSIQYAIAAGSRLFDFMQGDEEYKYHFGSGDYKVMRVRVQRSHP
jgi:CelD/BcsL family acetyltransferase involved in cellulose biosynthesis